MKIRRNGDFFLEGQGQGHVDSEGQELITSNIRSIFSNCHPFFFDSHPTAACSTAVVRSQSLPVFRANATTSKKKATERVLVS